MSRVNNNSVTSRICKAISPKRSRRKKTIHPCEEAFKYSIRHALLLMELNINVQHSTNDILVNNKRIYEAVNEAGIVYRSMSLQTYSSTIKGLVST